MHVPKCAVFVRMLNGPKFSLVLSGSISLWLILADSVWFYQPLADSVWFYQVLCDSIRLC